MGVYTYIEFFNNNDAEFQRAINGTAEELEEWEDYYGNAQDRPGADVATGDAIDKTYDEYGGWKIDLSKVPSNVTHIVVSRG